MRVDVVLRGVVDDQWAWARARAAERGLALEEYLSTLVEKDRRTVEGRPRLDPRTRRPGRRGAHAQMATDEYLATEIAAAVGVDHRQIGKWAAAGLLAPVRPGRQGVATAYPGSSFLAAAAVRELVAAGVDYHTLDGIAALAQHWPVVRDRYLVAALTGRCAVVGPDAIAGTARSSGGAILVVALEALARDLPVAA